MTQNQRNMVHKLCTIEENSNMYIGSEQMELHKPLKDISVSSNKDVLQTLQRIARGKDREIQDLRERLDKANAEKRGLIVINLL